MTRRLVASLCAFALLPILASSARSSTPTVETVARPVADQLAGMRYRSIGPFRGGRATAVAGVAGNDRLFYFGATGGGVWRTDDAGQSWRNISDKYFRTGSVGAIAVAPSDPNVVYVGM
ncbi:MAG: glycosyl hydrolase, partial [Acidobacteria bacterium]|nr:glycosyl hydrolase [Acidobacteriota bacterium]